MSVQKILVYQGRGYVERLGYGDQVMYRLASEESTVCAASPLGRCIIAL